MTSRPFDTFDWERSASASWTDVRRADRTFPMFVSMHHLEAQAACGLAFWVGQRLGDVEAQQVALDKQLAEHPEETVRRLQAENAELRAELASLRRPLFGIDPSTYQHWLHSPTASDQPLTIEELRRVTREVRSGEWNARALTDQINAQPSSHVVAAVDTERGIVTFSGPRACDYCGERPHESEPACSFQPAAERWQCYPCGRGMDAEDRLSFRERRSRTHAEMQAEGYPSRLHNRVGRPPRNPFPAQRRLDGRRSGRP